MPDEREPLPRQNVVPSHWEEFFRLTQIPAAVLVGDELRVTGHTGEFEDGAFSEDPVTQLRQTFANLNATLTTAGFSWADVIELTTYHVGLLAQTEMLLQVAAEFLPQPFPAWTAVGVTELFIREAVVEISCVARRSSRPPG